MAEKKLTVGVELLLERMKLFPEEFINKSGYEESKWHMLLPTTSKDDLEGCDMDVDYPELYLPPEEIAMLRESLKKVFADAYSQRVMEKLAEPTKQKGKRR